MTFHALLEQNVSVNLLITLRSFGLYILLIAYTGYAYGKETESNSSKLSELELAKKDAKDFKNLASLIKPSVVVIESVDRNGYEGGLELVLWFAKTE